MTRNTKYFIAAFLASLPFWVGVNAFSSNLENTFYLSQLSEYPEVLAAQTSQITQTKPGLVSRNNTIPYLSLETNAAFAVYVDDRGRTRTLFAKNQEQPLPIASLTKLMTSHVVAKYFPEKEIIPITARAVQKEEDTGKFRAGESFFAKDLLRSLLIESSNDAAAAFAQFWGRETFLNSMNEEAKTLGLEYTSFADEAGVDPGNVESKANLASAEDLFLLSKYILENEPAIFDILRTSFFNLSTSQGKFHHKVTTTNDLLLSNGWPAKVLGGKTGWTPMAKGCLLLVLEAPNQKGYIVNVILGSEDRFKEMKTMVDWTLNAYTFESL